MINPEGHDSRDERPSGQFRQRDQPKPTSPQQQAAIGLFFLWVEKPLLVVCELKHFRRGQKR